MIVKDTKTVCTHCNLPVPKGLLEPLQTEQFCCNGCRSAWHLIQSNGLGEFYRMVDATLDSAPNSFRTKEDERFEEFDRPSFLEKFSTKQNDLTKITLSLTGIHCAACVWLIEKLPMIVPGVLDAKVNWTKATVTILWHNEQTQLSEIAHALHQLGYTPYPKRNSRLASHRQIENRKQLTQIGIAAAAAGNNMLIAAALYLGMFSYMSVGIETLLRFASCAVGLVSFLGPGRVFLRGAINSLKTRTPHMDLPIALALTVGSIAGLTNTIRGVGEIYFDSLSVLICLLLIGRWIQFRQQNRAADAVELLYRLTPRRARKVVEGSAIDVAADELQPGDQIEILSGDLVAADGIVVEGQARVDESILTGESRPVSKSAEDEVFAGTKNVDSRLVVEVKAVAEQTRIHQVMQLVEEATNNKPRIVQWANQIGGYFVLTVITLSIITFLVWLFVDPERAVDRVVALLVVACPCALAMATPLAVSVALGRLAREKILVKAGDVLQSMSKPGTLWLDKTGTLTYGELRIASWSGDTSWIPIAAAIEQNFSHPVAKAFCKFNADELNNVEVMMAKQLDDGVSAIVDSQSVLIGSRKLIESKRVSISREWELLESTILAKKYSPCWIAVNNEIVAVTSIGDAIRPEAKQIVRELVHQGWNVGILSGDHRAIVASVADELDIETFHAEVTPQQKLEIIQQRSQDKTSTVMVGDGVNDSAALAAATVGIAVHGGAEASLAAAPVYLAEPGLKGIHKLVATAGAARQTIRINFGASLGYNILGVGLAIAGVLNPLVAAILMPLSSITVITFSLNAARSR